jgi:hypothetical protein
MRIFRVPEFLATAFLLGVLALLVHLLLGASPAPSRTQVVNLFARRCC